MRLVAEYADRAAVLRGGEIVFDGVPRDLFAARGVLDSARLKAPSVYEFSEKILGEPVLTTPELSRRLLEATRGSSRSVV
jgi:energy-coupling factor transporter ATP-binding protein EcfA2